MSDITPRSYFYLRLPLWVEAPSHRVEIDFDVSQASLQGHSCNVEVSFDEELFWRKIEAAGAWEWMTWEEWTKGYQAYFSAEYRFHSLLTIRHGGRERKNIILNDQPEKIAVLRSLLEPLASSADKCGVADCEYCVRTPSQISIRMGANDFQQGDAYDIDFERMEFRHATAADRVKIASPGSIAGYDADGFWERVATVGAWDWPSEKLCHCCDCRRRRDAEWVDLLTLRHAGRERRIREPERLRQVIDMLKPLTLGSLSVVINPSEPERCVHIEVAPDGPGVRIDFGRMEVALREKGDTYWGVSADGRPTALRHRSIRGFDEAAFWRRVSASAAWEAKPFFEDWHDAKGVPLAEGSLSIVMRNGVSFMRAKYACGPRRQLELLLELLSPLTFDSLRALVTPIRCEFRFKDSSLPGGRRRRIRLAGTSAVRATDELVAVGIRDWMEPVPDHQDAWWDAVEWESVEDELENGRPYVKPASLPAECCRKDEVQLADKADGQLGLVWGLKFIGEPMPLSLGGLVRDRIRVDAIVGCGVYDCCGPYWANNRKFTLLRCLLLRSYAETFTPPPFWSAQANDIWSAEDNYRGQPAADPAARHDYWLNIVPSGKVSCVLEGRSEEEEFRYEFIEAEKPVGLLPVADCPRPPAIGIMRVARRSFATGVSWTVDRPLSCPCLDRLSDLLEVGGVSTWADSPGWPGNSWSFRARVNGKTYECGGITATGGGIESPEPDPRLAVLRKILHFAG